MHHPLCSVNANNGLPCDCALGTGGHQSEEPPKTLHPYCGKCGWRKGGLDSWDGTRCRCGLSAPAIVFEVDAHPVDILREVAPSMFPGFEIDEASFRDAKTRLDATLEDLGTGPLEPE